VLDVLRGWRCGGGGDERVHGPGWGPLLDGSGSGSGGTSALGRSGLQVTEFLFVETLCADHFVAHTGTSPVVDLDAVPTVLDVRVEAVEKTVSAVLLSGGGSILLEQLVAIVGTVLEGVEGEDPNVGVANWSGDVISPLLGKCQTYAQQSC